jgi:ABC-type bacteriocin/lantibiotic exporter with double-glycine peptidase domain
MLANGPQTGNIEIGGLMLCRAPVDMVEQRNGYYMQQARDWMQSVDSNFMRENDPRMPLFNEKRSEVRFGKR